MTINYAAFQQKYSLKSVLSQLVHAPGMTKIAAAIGVLLVLIPIAIAIPVGLQGKLGDSGGGIFLAVLALAGIVLLVNVSRQAAQVAMLKDFAKLNGFSITDNQTAQYTGAVFGSQVVRVMAAVTIPGIPTVEIGNYHIVGPYGFSAGYVCIRLQHQLSHMLLASAHNFEIPKDIKDNGQPVEGALAEHFTLYKSAAAETQAQTLFTSEIMQLIVDQPENFSCEVVDNQLFLYARKQLKLTQSDTYERLQTLVGKLIERTSKTLDVFEDEYSSAWMAASKTGVNQSPILTEVADRRKLQTSSTAHFVGLLGLTGLIAGFIALVLAFAPDNSTTRIIASVLSAALIGFLITDVVQFINRFGRRK